MNFTDLTNAPISEAKMGVLLAKIHSRVYLKVNNDFVYAARLIREIQAEVIFVVMHNTYTDEVIDAICSRPAQQFLIEADGLSEAQVTRILETLTNLTKLSIPQNWHIKVPLPVSLIELWLHVTQVNHDSMAWLGGLVNLEKLYILQDHYMGIYRDQRWIDALAGVIRKMDKLTAIDIELDNRVDPLPLLLALSPSIRSIWMERGIEGADSIHHRFISAAPHAYPNMRHLCIGAGLQCTANSTKLSIQRRFIQEGICELDEEIEDDIIALMIANMASHK